MTDSDASFLRTLCSLRWLAIGGQAIAVLIAIHVLHLDFPVPPLAMGVTVLAIFNLYATAYVRHGGNASSGIAFMHVLADVLVLAWMLGWSGGIANPFSSMFLVLIALAAVGLPLRWVLATTAICLTGYAAMAFFGKQMPHMHGGVDFNLHVWGMAVNFLLCTGVVLYFSTRLVAELHKRERELADLRERFARNEGIVALATHAAAVAHELNTPLATMTLLADDIAEQIGPSDLCEDVDTIRELLGQCRERVLALAAPAHGSEMVALERVISQWQLVRPTIYLVRDGTLPAGLMLDAAVGHLLQALLNNAADAGEQVGHPQVDLRLRIEGSDLVGEVRDYGTGFDPAQARLPTTLFHSGKSGGLGVGLALSHATIERLGGTLWMSEASGRGACVHFRLPLNETMS